MNTNELFVALDIPDRVDRKRRGILIDVADDDSKMLACELKLPSRKCVQILRMSTDAKVPSFLQLSQEVSAKVWALETVVGHYCELLDLHPAELLKSKRILDVDDV